MAISFVGSLPPVGANNGGNVTLSFSNLRDAAGGTPTLQQDDVVVCAYACSGTADHAMSTSSSGWTEVSPEVYADNAIDTNLALYWKVMGSSPDTQFVAVGPTGNSNATIAVAFAFRGVDTTTPMDVAAQTATGLASALNPPSITPTTTGAWPLIVGAGVAGTGAAFTNSDLSSTTNHFRSANHAETNDVAIGLGIKTNWASGAFDPAAWGGFAAPASWASLSIALRPAAPPAQTLTPSLFTNSNSFPAPTVAQYLALIAITNNSGTTVTPSGDGWYRAEKTGGTNNLFNADAVSSSPATGDFELWTVPVANTNDSVFGVNADPTTDSNYTGIDYAWTVSGGTAYVYINGSLITSGAYTGSLGIRRVGSTVYWLYGDRSSPSTMHSVGSATGDLYFDSSFYLSGATLDVLFYEVAAAQALTPSLLTNTQTFHAPTVSATYALTPDLFTNSQAFHAPTITTGAVDLTPSLVTNTQAFHGSTVSATYALTPGLYSNTQAFYDPTVAPGAVDLAPSLLTNTQTFYAPEVALAAQIIEPGFVTNSQTFYDATVTSTYDLAPSLVTNTQTFHAATVSATYSLEPALFTNTATFYSPTISTTYALSPALVTNTSTIHAPTVSSTYALLASLLSNTNTFYGPTLVRAPSPEEIIATAKQTRRLRETRRRYRDKSGVWN